jgi:Rod binding domain-containing protein
MEPVTWPPAATAPREGLMAAPREPRAESAPDLARAAQEFEAYLVGALLRTGTSPTSGEGLLDGGAGGRLYRELFYEEVARLAARGPGFGIAGLLRGASSGAGALR